MKRLCRYGALVIQCTLGALLAGVGFSAQAGCLDQARLTGVNLAGAEFNAKKLPGVVFKDYTYPSKAELAFIASQGANIIRLPFAWERLQPVAMGPLNQAELGHLRSTVANANALGLCVLLDAHNYATYYQYKLVDTLPDGAPLSSAFIDFWLKVADTFPEPDTVALGLMNEPSAISVANWAAIAKQTLAALRAAESKHYIFVAGGRWSGVHDWFAGLLHSNSTEFDDLQDPLKRAIIEVHQYTDSDYSGTHTAATGQGCRAADEFNAKFERITQWAKTHQQTLFLGEFGVPSRSDCLLTLTRFLELTNDSPWRGWAYWAAGSWWGNYPLALSGPKQPTAPQWGPLKTYFYDAAGHNGISPPISPAPDAPTP